MSKTHYGYESYDPYGEDIPDQYACGTWVGYDYSVTTIKDHISCKKCLKKYDAFVEIENEMWNNHIEQLGEMADFWIDEENKKENKNNS